MKVLDYDQAHEWVDKNRAAFWDGWDIVVFRPNHNGATNLRGMYRNNMWGIATNYPLKDDGTWLVP
jgi:hypothetical protein